MRLKDMPITMLICLVGQQVLRGCATPLTMSWTRAHAMDPAHSDMNDVMANAVYKRPVSTMMRRILDIVDGRRLAYARNFEVSL